VREAPLDVAARVAAATAHEFNNHLAAIALQAELALAGAGEDQRLRRRLEGILGSCESAREMTRALLAFGSRRPLHARRVEIGEALRRLAGDAVRVTAPEEKLFVEVDPDAFAEAVAEVIAQTGDGAVTVSGRAKDDLVEVSLRGGGPAPDEETRDRIFEPYFVEDPERPLGLAVAWGFVRQSGGTIDLEAADGGAIVTIRLPRAPG
jgi:C4-dicarboxylate-specific signal transduction histidine kinase